MAGSTVAASIRQEPTVNEKWYDKWRWYERNTSTEEKALLRKLDFMILTFGCLTFFTKASTDYGRQDKVTVACSGCLTAFAYSSSIFKHSKMHMSAG